MSDHTTRLETTRSSLPALGVEALLITNLTNVRYLCGFSGTNGQLFISRDRFVFLTDPRYEARASSLVTEADVEIYPARLTDRLIPLLGAGVGRLGIEAGTMTLAARDDLATRMEGVQLVPTTGVVEGQRRKKDPGEVQRLRNAVELAERAFAWVLDRIVPGATERELALALEMRMRQEGAEGVAFPPIVGSGPLSAHIHHTPTDRGLEKGDLVLVDFGCRLDGYCSDCTRTVVIGPATDEQRDMYELVLAAQTAGMIALREGTGGADADRAARDVIEAAGKGSLFGHGLGHGVGLEVHEQPTLKGISDDVLAVGDVVTVEPGVYVQGNGGVRIEDCVLVTAEGPEVLGSAPKDELIEL